MAKNKTTETSKSVTAFINTASDETKREDSFQLIELITRETGFEPKMWGPSIVGFGNYHYRYESGREGDMPLAGFSPRAAAIVLYLSGNFEKRDELLQTLGKYKTGKGCVYIKRLEDIDIAVLKKMIVNSVKHIRSLYPEKSNE
jgi:Domain of unknown function (DU1801)